jgi:hypothetical protein
MQQLSSVTPELLRTRIQGNGCRRNWEHWKEWDQGGSAAAALLES